MIKKKFMLLGVVGILFILCTLGFMIWRAGQMGVLTVNSAPAELTLTLDGKQITSIGTLRVSPGDHTLNARMNGFAEKRVDFQIGKGEEKTVDIYIEPNSPEGFRYLDEHPEEKARIEGLFGKEFNQRSQEATQKNPIIENLPVIDRTFRIDYGPSVSDPNNHQAITVYVRAISQQGRNDALDWMRTFEYNPEDYEIIYINPNEE